MIPLWAMRPLTRNPPPHMLSTNQPDPKPSITCSRNHSSSPSPGPAGHDPRSGRSGTKPGAVPSSRRAETLPCCPGTCFSRGSRHPSCSKAAAEEGLEGWRRDLGHRNYVASF